MPSDPAERTIGGRDLTHWRTSVGRWLSVSVGKLARRLGLEPVLLIGVAAALGLFVLAAVTAGEVYEAVVENSGIALLDQPVQASMVTLRSPALDEAVAAFSNSGGPVWMPVIAGTAALLMGWCWRTWSPVVLMVVATAGSLAMTVAGKRLVGRARPPLADSVPPYETSASFPSGHSLNSIVIAGLICYLLLAHLSTATRRALLVLGTVLYVAAMGLSRVFLGHHWLSDVLMAWALGLAWLTVVITAHRLWLGRAVVRPLAS